MGTTRNLELSVERVINDTSMLPFQHVNSHNLNLSLFLILTRSQVAPRVGKLVALYDTQALLKDNYDLVFLGTHSATRCKIDFLECFCC